MRKRYTLSAEELGALTYLRRLLRIKQSAKLPAAWEVALLRIFHGMPHEDRHDDSAVQAHIGFVERVCSVAGYACEEAVRNVQHLLGGHDKRSLLGQIRAAIECLQLIEAALVATLQKADGPPSGEPTKKP